MQCLSMRALPVAHYEMGVLMKIYLVTVSDQETIDDIDHAIEANEYLFIGPWVRKGQIEEIQEYVNVDSP